MQNRFLSIILSASLLFMFGCGVLREKPTGNLIEQQANQPPMTPEQAKEVLSEAGGNWLYGNGFGETLLTVGTVLVFPPFGAVILGNAALDIAGYEQVGVSTFLPEQDKQQWLEFYGSVTAGPGKAVAAVAGEEFRTPEENERRMARFTQSVPQPVLPAEASIEAPAESAQSLTEKR